MQAGELEPHANPASTSILALHGCAADTLALSAYLSLYGTHVILGKAIGEKEFDEEDSKKICTYVVNNKYFTADLDVRRILYSTTSERACVPSSGSEGFILVLSQESAESRLPSAAQSDALLAAASSAAEDEDVSVRLVVVLSPASASASVSGALGMPAREAWVSWCCDHSFEFVEICTGTAAALRDTHEERDKDGLPRVVEALSSHMWRSMRRKEGHGLASSAAQVPALASEPLEAPAQSTHSSAPAAATVPAGATTSKEDDSSGNPFLAELLASNANTNTDEKDDEASLFSMVDQAKALRAAVEAGTVSDDQRKAQAEAIAMRFMSMLDMGDDSGDDSD